MPLKAMMAKKPKTSKPYQNQNQLLAYPTKKRQQETQNPEMFYFK